MVSISEITRWTESQNGFGVVCVPFGVPWVALWWEVLFPRRGPSRRWSCCRERSWWWSRYSSCCYWRWSHRCCSCSWWKWAKARTIVAAMKYKLVEGPWRGRLSPPKVTRRLPFPSRPSGVSTRVSLIYFRSVSLAPWAQAKPCCRWDPRSGTGSSLLGGFRLPSFVVPPRLRCSKPWWGHFRRSFLQALTAGGCIPGIASAPGHRWENSLWRRPGRSSAMICSLTWFVGPGTLGLAVVVVVVFDWCLRYTRLILPSWALLCCWTVFFLVIDFIKSENNETNAA